MNKIITLTIVWGMIVFSYIMLAAISPAINEIATESSIAIQASGNMTEQPGIQGAVESSNVWMWIIPGFCGIVYTVWVLKYQDKWSGRG